MMIYAGIGSRETPQHVLDHMRKAAAYYETQGYILRSGGAYGADMAFESGVKDPKNMEIYFHSDATPAAIEMASRYHPAWDKCSDYARRLHGRNMMIVLGANLDTPVDFIMCWTQLGQVRGGTGQALRLALDRGIKIVNLFYAQL